MKISSIQGFIALAGVIATVGCQTNAENLNQASILPIPVKEVTTSSTTLQQSYVADIQAVQNVEIRNRVAGYLDKIFIDEGERVKKGQALFQINDDEYRAEVAKAKATLSSAVAENEAADLEIDRIQILVNKNIVAEGDLAVAKAKRAALQAKITEAQSVLSNAEKQLTYTIIRAPFDGIVNRIPMKTGSLLAEGTLLTSVSDVSYVYAYFNLSESEYLQFAKEAKSGDFGKVSLQLADGSIYSIQGDVETSASIFEKGTGSIAFRAKFHNPQKFLKHGATGKVLIDTEVQDAILIPQKAVFEIQDRSFVYVLKEDNTVEMKSFIPEKRTSDQFIVAEGIEAGDKIVCEGVQNIRNGMEIQPVYNSDSTNISEDK
ncbi:efflux RND transporter periplasmic adaptor subunit [Gynurincola endophyticus]|uniref:efflux RND transporter periplasmic adaptor subunit n=1 Tax=Gynurincola endophyticus TaxID=2479004 RepID=UPI000F8F6A9C|nr:efflux RND transporter periplasmic adaptor subunit [Gynurincola endophyticus]